MKRHLVLVTDLEFEEVISGREYLVKFFKKRFDFIDSLKKGDLIYIRKRLGEVLAQFNVGKLVLIEGASIDLRLKIAYPSPRGSKDLSFDFDGGEFGDLAGENSVVIIMQIVKLEQFITSPIEMPKIKKEWIIIEDY